VLKGKAFAGLKRQHLRSLGLALAGLCVPALLLNAPGGEGQPVVKPAEKEAIRVLVVYYSLTGNTEQMAQGVADGIKRVPGAVPVVKKADEATPKDLGDADAIILGCPTYFGSIPGQMKAVMDEWNWKLKVDFTDKIGGAFTTGGGQAAGKEFTLISLLLFMLNNRMVVAGPLYQNDQTGSVWGEAGASAMTGPLDPGVSAAELDSAHRLGERIARLALKLKKPSTN
jgi:NAD(P)H dehydrogenase (quinone)